MCIYVLLAIRYGKPIQPFNPPLRKVEPKIHFLEKSGAKIPPLKKVEPKFYERKTDIKIHKNIILFFLLYNPHGILAP